MKLVHGKQMEFVGGQEKPVASATREKLYLRIGLSLIGFERQRKPAQIRNNRDALRKIRRGCRHKP